MTPDAVNIAEAKRRLRSAMRAERKALDASTRVAAGAALRDRLHDIPGVRDARSAFVYMSFGAEIDTRPFCHAWLQENKTLALPRVCGDLTHMEARCVSSLDFVVAGYKGCPEPDRRYSTPIIPEELDIIVLPGLAFDTRGNRLGQGGGHYDRFLQRVSSKTLLIGAGYDFQVLEAVPADPDLDRPIQWIATPKRAFPCAAE